jgi:3-oxoacyl-(acyl-carrier-protein) synthase III
MPDAPVRLSVRIAATASVEAGPAVSTAELVKRLTPAPDAAEIEARTGIATRHFAGTERTAAELSARALGAALDTAGLPATALRRLIFVSSVGGDVLIPATASLVGAALGLRGTCDCFDLNNACMGFLTAFDLAARSIATGLGPVGIVVGELPSRYIHPGDPRPFLVVGDAVSAAVLDRGRPGEGILASALGNDGPAGGDVTLAQPGLTGRAETVRFAATNERMREHAIAAVRRSMDAVLGEAGVALDEIEWFVLHQPNGVLFEAMIDALGLDPERTVRIAHEVGSVGAASLPLGLDRLLRTRPVGRGDRILFLGVGAGLSFGTMLYRVAP